MLDSISELEDLTGFINDFLEDSIIWSRLEWDRPGGQDTFVLTQFLGRFDLCDVVLNESDQEIALEFLFHPVDGDEVPSISLPIDPDDVEVNILDNGLEIQSLDFYLLLTIANRSPNP